MVANGGSQVESLRSEKKQIEKIGKKRLRERKIGKEVQNIHYILIFYF